MSEFNVYARQFDDIATGAFADYQAANEEYKAAQAAVNERPERRGIVNADYAAAAARAKANLLEATEKFRNEKVRLAGHDHEISKIRRDLSAAVDNVYSSDPSKVDIATVELLKSGAMRPFDYEKLLAQFVDSGNFTMVQLVGRYAKVAADAAATPDAAAELNAIERRSRTYSGHQYIEAFDSLVSIFARCVANPSMIPYWDSLTKDTIDAF